VLLATAGAVVLGGLLFRSVPGVLGDVGGGVLYAVLLFLLIAVLTPAASSLRIGAVSLGVCVGIELLQLTGLPTIAAELVPPIRYVLGTTFSATDLLAYAGGTFAAVAVDLFAVRRASSDASAEGPSVQ
jgi:hypothetical protein